MSNFWRAILPMPNLLPHFIIENFEKQCYHGHLQAVVVFVDISGFTAMTEQLMSQGKVGAEALAEAIQSVFDPLIQHVYEQQGFISTFGGDAFQAIFPMKGHSTYSRALVAATGLQQHLASRPAYSTPFGTFSFSVKVGLADGPLEWGILLPMAKTSLCQYYFRGPAIDRSTEAEKNARGGEIIIHSQAMPQVQSLIETEPVAKSEFHRYIQPKSPLPLTIATFDPDVINDLSAAFIPADILHQTSQGEFRHVLTLFLSLKNPESHGQLAAFYKTVADLQLRYGGYLNKVNFDDKGGTILLFWGAPRSYENDINRALNFVEELKSTSQILFRAGVTYRIMYTGFIGSNLRKEYSCYGRGVNLAVRQMMQADWQEIWLDEITAHVAADLFETELIGRFAFKGFVEEMPVYRLGHRKETLQFSFYRGKIVGRKQELVQLTNFIQAIFNNRFAGVTVVYGDAGMGKSRLLEEFKQTLSPPPGLTPLWIHCPADEVIQHSLHPFRYFLRNYFQQSPQHSVEQNKALFQQRLSILIKKTPHEELSKELARTHSILGALVDLHWDDSLYSQLDPQARFENTLSAIKSLLKAESLIHPVIVEIENGQWLDEDTLSLLHYLTRNIHNFPLAFFISCRTGHRLPEFDNEIPFFTLELAGLSDPEVTLLGETILNRKIAPDLVRQLKSQTGSNPFFIEQTLRYLEEAGYLTETEQGLALKGSRVVIPATLQSTLISRLDRLSPGLKEAIQTAAVIGHVFELGVLRQMLAHADDLKRDVEEAVAEDIWQKIDRETVTFKNVMMREAAYEMQLQARQRQLHRQAAEVILAYFQHDPAPHYDAIAFHYETAEDQHQAALFYVKAGHVARQGFQNERAVACYQKAAAYFKKQPLNEPNAWVLIDVYRHLAEIYRLTGRWDETVSLLDEAIEISRKFNLTDQTLELYGQLGEVYYTRHDRQKAVELYQKNLQTYRARANYRGIAEMVTRIGQIYLDQKDRTQAMRYFKEGLWISEKSADKLGISRALNGIGQVLIEEGDYDSAMTHFERAFVLDVELGDKRIQATTFSLIGSIYYQQADYDKALRCHEQQLSISEILGDKINMSQALEKIGRIYEQKREFNAAAEVYERFRQISNELDHNDKVENAEFCLGRAYMHLKQYDLAEYFLQQSWQKSVENDNIPAQLAVSSLLGRTYYRMGLFNEAFESFGRCLNHTGFSESVLESSYPYGDMAHIFFEQGDYFQALMYYEKSEEIARAQNDYDQLGDVYYGLGNLHYQQQHYDEALGFYERYLAICQEQGIPATNEDAIVRAAILYYGKGNTEKQNGHFDRAQEFYEKVLELSKQIRDLRSIGQVVRQLGLVFEEKGQYKKAISYLNHSLKMLSALEDHQEEAITLGYLADLFFKTDDFEHAVTFYTRQAQIYRSFKDHRAEAKVLEKTGLAFLKNNNLEKSLTSFKKAITLNNSFDDQRAVAHNWGQLGRVYQAMKKYKQAIECYVKQMNVYQVQEDRKGVCQAYHAMHLVHIDRGDLTAALNCLTTQKKMAEEDKDFQELFNILGNMARIYYQKQNFAKAMDCTKQQRELSREIREMSPSRKSPVK